MSTRTSGYVLCIACSLFAAGCDPVRTTSQPVRLRVVDSASGGPAVAGTQVSLKDDFETAEPLSQETAQPPLSADEWHNHKRDFWDQLPWFRGVTDKHGQVEIPAKYPVLDRSWGSKPPAWRDWVTGRPFLVRVKEGQAPEEELSVVMKAGASVKGKSYTVTVIDIEQPRYVPTDE